MTHSRPECHNIKDIRRQMAIAIKDYSESVDGAELSVFSYLPSRHLGYQRAVVPEHRAKHIALAQLHLFVKSIEQLHAKQ